MILDNYPGAKSGSGIVQWLINNIPYHERYFELFAGSAQLFKAKKPAQLSVLSELNTKVWWPLLQSNTDPNALIYNKACLTILDEYNKGFQCIHTGKFDLDRNDFIYLDPPYPISSLRNGKKHYKYIMTDQEHEMLLNVCKETNAKIMISTKHNDLYEDVLKGWRKKTMQTVDHVGAYEEVIYMNYREPGVLHQYDYLGTGCTDRQRIKRKIARFSTKIAMLPAYERHLFIQEMLLTDRTAVIHFLSTLPGSID